MDGPTGAINSMPPCVRQGVMCEGWSRNQIRSHSSVIARRSSEVWISCWARRTGSPEYIGIRQPVLDTSATATVNSHIAFFIARSS
jgi:hypothetical protein